MKLDFADYRVTIAVVPIDLRAGYERLSAIASCLMDINVDGGKDVVVFMSKSRRLCKVIWADGRGRSVLNRRLNHGSFQKLLARAEDPNGLAITKDEVLRYLDGEVLQAPRVDFSINI